jgi:hypothetical protein
MSRRSSYEWFGLFGGRSGAGRSAHPSPRVGSSRRARPFGTDWLSTADASASVTNDDRRPGPQLLDGKRADRGERRKYARFLVLV